MRYRLAVLMLLLLLVVLMLHSMLPVMNIYAAPTPDPYAILDISLPPEGKSTEEHCKEQICRLTNPGGLIQCPWIPPELWRKLPSVARLKDDAHPWMAKNIRATPENGGRLLRLTFRAGNRTEQVVILNGLLRSYFELGINRRIKNLEEWLQQDEQTVSSLEKHVEMGLKYGHNVDSYRRGLNNFRFNRIPARRAEIDRLKQVIVLKWAK